MDGIVLWLRCVGWWGSAGKGVIDYEMMSFDAFVLDLPLEAWLMQ